MKSCLIIFVAALFVNLSKAQTAAADNKLSQSITFRSIPKGPSVYGTFEGRPPCRDIAKQVDSPASAECIKVKWSLTLYHDPVTKQPSTYKTLRSRFLPAEGKWTIVRGIPSNPDAAIIQLDLAKPGTYLYLLKGDENVLFILDENKNFRVGNDKFSFTLNRVELIPANKNIK